MGTIIVISSWLVSPRIMLGMRRSFCCGEGRGGGGNWEASGGGRDKGERGRGGQG